MPSTPPEALRVLLVEDDLDTRANVDDILQLDGHQVGVAGSFAEAKSLAAETDYAIVILDRRLPDGNADDRLPDLLKWLPHSDVIVVTGFAELDSTIAAFRHGIADYILKPINPDALRQSVRRIVERRSIESKLRREQQFANLILDTAEAVILVLDAQGRIVRFNPFFERLSGWRLSEMIGQDWFTSFVTVADRDRIREVFMRTLGHEESGDTETTVTINGVLTRSGGLRQIRWSNTALKNEFGEIASVLAVGVDVSDVLDAQERALQAERLAAIGKTMTALAHESRNALQRIQAGLEMLELELEDNQDVRQDLGSIRRATEDMQSLLEEVRSFAAPILLHIEQTSLPVLWRRVWRQITRTLDQPPMRLVEEIASLDDDASSSDTSHHGDPSHETELAAEPVPLDAPERRVATVPLALDVLRMEQVFRNLFENSLAAGASIVKIRLIRPDPDFHKLTLIVSDSGPGFGRADLNRLFEPFYTTKPTGTGLGLAIVQRIIEAHQGTISAESSDQGAEFRISLPTGLTPSAAPRKRRRS